MRFFAVSLVVVFTAPAFAADKDEEKAKEAATVFLKGLKEKDLDAMMKVADVPFAFDADRQDPRMIEKRDELKEKMAKFIDGAVPEKVKALEVGTVYDMAGFAKYIKDLGKAESGSDFVKQAEKLAGKDGRIAMLVIKGGKEVPGFLIRFKEGKAFVVSAPQ
jgi:hypothetical protein